MGNRTGCGIFQGPRGKEDKYWVEGIDVDDNRIIKQMYYSLNIQSKPLSFSLNLHRKGSHLRPVYIDAPFSDDHFPQSRKVKR